VSGPAPRVTVAIPTFNRADWLRQTVASVLAQEYRAFRVLVSDNASEDHTAGVVASFEDPRIAYSRAERNLGLIGNFNRALELVDTEYVVLLPDDDLLYPGYLERVLAVADGHPGVGVVHTACDLIDASSAVFRRGVRVVETRRPVEVETGKELIERSLRSTWTVCWSSALFRTEAAVAAGGLREDEHPYEDLPFMMRIGLSWDFAFVSEPLVAFRLHAASATASQGSYADGAGYRLGNLADVLYERRMRFLDEAGLPALETEALRTVAVRTFRRDRIRRLAVEAGSGVGWRETNRRLAELVRHDSRTLLDSATWRLLAAQAGGRRAKRAARRIAFTD
jgi:glycosyltransferase involved in cell wall biosynthesis